MRHGKGERFSCKGIQIVIEHWRRRGHRVIAFAPDYLLKRDKILQQWDVVRMASEDIGSVDSQALAKILKDKQQLPDDVDYLIWLADQGVLVTTPPQDYDDSYSISYAKQQM